MRETILLVIIAMAGAAPAPAVEFLGVNLCREPVSTAIVLPEGSPLVVKSVEAGSQGGLVILFSTDEGDPLQIVDALMEAELGRGGSGDEKSLTWAGGDVVAYAQPISKTYAALAIRGGTECTGDTTTAPQPSAPITSEPPVAETTSSAAEGPAPAAETVPSPPAKALPPAPPVPLPTAPTGAAPTPSAPQKPDFELQGDLRHEAASDDWVDVMGVVANNTADGYRLATFDVSLYDAAGDLICVDTISVSVLKPGQERAFRDSIRCPGYDPAAVATWKLQFAGGF